MTPSERYAIFPQLLKLSLGLVLLSVALTFDHAYQWSWLGRVGLSAIPLGIFLAAFIFYVAVLLVSHRVFGVGSFYSLMQQLHVLTRHLSWWQIVVLSLLAGLGEELLFRGFVQSALLSLVGAYTAIVISSLIFGLLHAMTKYYFVFAFTLSLVFGILFHSTQSMLLLVTLHAVYDVIALGVIAKYPHYVGVSAADQKGDNDSGTQLKL